MDMSPHELAAADRRCAAIDEAVDGLVLQWRIQHHHCTADDRTAGDITADTIAFRDRLMERFATTPLDEVCEALTVAIRRLAAIPVNPPDHQWVACNGTGGQCSCGWVYDSGIKDEATRAWENHAGTHTLITSAIHDKIFRTP